MRCADCQWKYPDAFLSTMMVSGKYTDPICGICALERANQATGIRRTHFQGEQAEYHRKSALAWRKSHPQDGPQVM